MSNLIVPSFLIYYLSIMTSWYRHASHMALHVTSVWRILCDGRKHESLTEPNYTRDPSKMYGYFIFVIIDPTRIPLVFPQLVHTQQRTNVVSDVITWIPSRCRNRWIITENDDTIKFDIMNDFRDVITP